MEGCQERDAEGDEASRKSPAVENSEQWLSLSAREGAQESTGRGVGDLSEEMEVLFVLKGAGILSKTQ